MDKKDIKENRFEKLKRIQSIRDAVNDGQFRDVLRELPKLLSGNDNDSELLYIYGKILRKTGQYDTAIEVLERLVQKDATGFENFHKAAYCELFKLYYINDYYEKAYKLLLENKVIFEDKPYMKKDLSLSLYKDIIEIRLGIYKENGNEKPVLYKLLHYDKQLALNHVKKHLANYYTPELTMFEDIDIDRLFTAVETVLPTSNKMQKLSSNDSYMFKFFRIGKNSITGEQLDNLQVITNKGTNEIVAMYPTKSEFRGIINNNLYDTYLENSKPKEKVLTQVEKFNKRYNIEK